VNCEAREAAWGIDKINRIMKRRMGKTKLKTEKNIQLLDTTESLPDGWVKANICEISNIVYGKGLSKKNISKKGEFPVFGANSIIGYHNSFLYEKPQVLISC